MKTLAKLKEYLSHIFYLANSPLKVTEIYYADPYPNLASDKHGLYDDCYYEYKLLEKNIDVEQIFFDEEAGARPIHLHVIAA